MRKNKKNKKVIDKYEVHEYNNKCAVGNNSAELHKECSGEILKRLKRRPC